MQTKPVQALIVIEAVESRLFYDATPAQIVPIHGGGCGCTVCAGRALASASVEQTFAPAAAIAAASTFSAKINFQPAASSTPEGYTPDKGKTYGLHDDGLTYGWKTDNAANMRDRNSAFSPDDRYDTLARFANSQKWELAVPKGTYSVRLVAGDAGYTDSKFKFAVENVTAMDAKPAGTNYWVERSITVNVNDGRLTITAPSGSSNGKLNFVQVNQVAGALKVTGKINWSKQGDGKAPISRVESAVVQLGNKLYVMGGYNGTYNSVTGRVDILDLATRKWSVGASLPGAQTHAGSATDGRYIYYVAGQYGPLFSTNGTNEGWRYDPATNKWSRFANLPKVRFGGGLAFVGGKLHFFGGDDATRNVAQKDHWVLNPADANPSWKLAAPMPFPGDHLSHVVEGGKLYVFGGEHDHGKTYVQHDYAYRYEPSTDKWTRLADMPTPKSHFEGSTLAINGKIYCIGGQIDHELLTSEVSVYDIANNKWSLSTSFVEQRKGVAAGVYNGKIYLTGGDAFRNGQPRDLWIGVIS